MTADEIRQQYTMQDILLRYGLQANKNGFIICPFHKEKTASLKIKKHTWKCHGCNKGGSVFDFVMEMENIDWKEAFLSLGGTYENTKENFAAKLRLEKAMREQEKRIQANLRQKRFKHDISNLIEFYRSVMALYEPMSDIWCEAQYKLFILLYAFEEKYLKGEDVDISGITSRHSKSEFTRNFIR